MAVLAALTAWVMAVAALIPGFREIRIIMATRVGTTSEVIRGSAAAVWLSEQPKIVE